MSELKNLLSATKKRKEIFSVVQAQLPSHISIRLVYGYVDVLSDHPPVKINAHLFHGFSTLAPLAFGDEFFFGVGAAHWRVCSSIPLYLTN